jgi:dipeptidase E
MKLLLTSGGLCTDELVSAMVELAGRPAGELSLVYIPTAANVEDEDKTWLIDHLIQLKSVGLSRLDIVDISGLERDQWFPRLQRADVLYVEGGNTEFLWDIVRSARLDEDLIEWVKTKVYVGVSAGSVLVGPIIGPSGTKGLSLVDFLVIPHMNAPYRSRTEFDVRSIAHRFGRTTYWIDDQTGILIDDARQCFVGSGYRVFNTTTRV